MSQIGDALENDQQHQDQMASKELASDGTASDGTASDGTASDGTAPQPEAPAEPAAQEAEQAVFPIVGIGASAGGLEAFENFFTNMPPQSGMAFVLVQHLDPQRESMLVDLLQRYTRMQVLQAEDGVAVQPNHVYVIPPNRELALLHGKVHLQQPSEPRGQRLPIDYFFRSLAVDQREKGICIILSGTGTDGTLGLKAIKGEGGMAMVQDPGSAKYDGMPRSAIATGLVDYVLPPQEMPEPLLAYGEHAFGPEGEAPLKHLPDAADELKRVFVLLRNETGHDFSAYKQSTIGRRIERRMAVNQVRRIQDYVRYLEQNPIEVETLFRELLIGVTNFFRDPEVFELLEREVVPRLFKGRAQDEAVRIWVPGCSTGEEAYSIAMLLREHMDRSGEEYPIQIFATDIDSEAIEKARRGVYPDSIVADVSPDRLNRFFIPADNTYKIGRRIREMLVFAQQNMIQDPPFSRLDWISCRNVLIYMQPDLQKRVLRLLHFALKPGGVLMLGPSETLGEYDHLFSPVERRLKLFRSRESKTALRSVLDFPIRPAVGAPAVKLKDANHQVDIGDFVDDLLLDKYTPPTVVVNERAEILFVRGRTGKYLELAEGKANWNLLRMAREGLRMPLTTTLRKAIQQKEEVTQRGVKIQFNGQDQRVDLVVHPIQKPAALQGLVAVLFEETPEPEPVQYEVVEDGVDQVRDRRMVELERELNYTKEYLQTTVEELETSNEELMTINEELQSSNEELQSTNEELETSQEELQAVNEELVTVNSELENKIQELTRVNNDLNNLLSGIQVGVIFVDQDLHIRRFNPLAAEVVNVIESDVGRYIGHLGHNLQEDRLVPAAKAVLRTLDPYEKEVQTADGDWYWMQIRPYRTAENAIDGLAITFTDITEQRQTQEQVRKLARAVEQSSSMITITDRAGAIEYVNSQFTQVTGYAEPEILGRTPDLLKSDRHDDAFYQHMWETLLAGEEWRGEIYNRKKNGDGYWESATIAPIQDEAGELTHFVKVAEDVTARKREQARIHFQTSALDQVQDAVIVVDNDESVVYLNRAAARQYGLDREETLGQRLADVYQYRWVSDGDEQAARQALAEQGSWTGENVHVKQNGERVRVSSRVSVLENEQGQRTGLLAVIHELGPAPD